MNTLLAIFFLFFKQILITTGKRIEPENPVIKPGKFQQWREALKFFAGDEIPDCKEKCTEKCQNEYKGVALCSSFLESIDQEPEIIEQVGNGTTTEVKRVDCEEVRRIVTSESIIGCLCMYLCIRTYLSTVHPYTTTAPQADSYKSELGAVLKYRAGSQSKIVTP